MAHQRGCDCDDCDHHHFPINANFEKCVLVLVLSPLMVVCWLRGIGICLNGF